MKTSVLVAGGLCLLLAGMSAFHTRSLMHSNETDFKAIDEYVTARMRSDRIPGLALAIVKGDQIVYLKGYGQADPSGRPVTPQTPFIIGSITKPFTALAVMQLVDAGKVELDAPVQRYIPWFRPAGSGPAGSAHITVRMLINQTSGLPGCPDPAHLGHLALAECPRCDRAPRPFAANAKLVFPPGQGFYILQCQLRHPGDDHSACHRAGV